MTLEFAGAALPLGPNDIADEAAALGVDPAAVHAVCDIESGGSGFLSDGRPQILFESHAFDTATHGKYRASHPDVSTSSWMRNYGAAGAHQYDRMAEAIGLDRAAALSSASWGRFQIMGSNHAICGFADVESFVAAMMASERAQLDAFAAFCKGAGALAHLKAHDWAGFARIYNGPGYEENGYDTKLAAAWAKWNARPDAAPGNSAPRTVPAAYHATLQIGSTGDDVRALQAALGMDPADGDFGPKTRAAVMAFQQAHGLGDDGIVGPLTLAALGIGAAQSDQITAAQVTPQPSEPGKPISVPPGQLSPHFTLDELTFSDTARRRGIPNDPTNDPVIMANLTALANDVLEPIRAQFGAFSPNSAYRSPAVNEAVGGVSKSQHMTGQAADINIPSVSRMALAEWCRDNLPTFDQIILEYDSWVHVSYVKGGPNRRQCLTIHSGGGGYISGLEA